MDEHSHSTFRTNSRLMANLHDGSAAAWDEFVAKYTRLIHHHCRKHHLPEADIPELTQEVLIRLFVAFQTFEYDREKGKFRGFLHKTTEFAIKDFWRKRGRQPRAIGGDGPPGGWTDTPSNERFIDDLVEALQYADVESMVLDDVLPWQKDAYLLWRQGAPDEAIADCLEQKVGTVRVARLRIVRRIENELKEQNGP